MKAKYKPVGGVERVALYPTDAVVAALFSKDGCEITLSSATPIAVELLDNLSHYEEQAKRRGGATKISHRLNLVADRVAAAKWCTPEFLERCAVEGVIAVISLCDGRHLLAGYSAQFCNEQPLRIEQLISSSGEGLKEMPTITLQLSSHDTEFSQEILEVV